MLQSLLNYQISRAERTLGVPLDYARYMAAASFRSLWKLTRFTRLVEIKSGRYRDALHVASIVSAQADDCGSCVQIGVNLALKAGVNRDIVAAVVRRKPDQLPGKLRDVYRFTEAVTRDSIEQQALRQRIKEHYGDEGLVQISMAIALHRVFPTLKRALGYATSCARETIEL